MAEYINKVIKDNISKKPLSFIWTTPRKTLSIQSKNKLEFVYKKEKIIKCSFFEELNENRTIIRKNIFLIKWLLIQIKIDVKLIYLRIKSNFYLLSI